MSKFRKYWKDFKFKYTFFIILLFIVLKFDTDNDGIIIYWIGEFLMATEWFYHAVITTPSSANIKNIESKEEFIGIMIFYILFFVIAIGLAYGAKELGTYVGFQ